MANILVIDDDEKIRRIISRILGMDYTIDAYESFSQISKDQLKKYQLILLDIMMPGQDGYEVCRTIRDIVDCPIIFLTAKSQEEDVVYGLGLGADDFIKKPFEMAELRARIQAHLRREQREKHTSFFAGDYCFDLKRKILQYQQKEVPLTKGEYEICEYLARNKGQVFTKEQIYEAVFGYDGNSNDSTIATHIKNIRSKLSKGAVPIKTVWGIGYQWENETK